MGRNAFSFKRTSLQQTFRAVVLLSLAGMAFPSSGLDAAPLTSVPALTAPSPFLRLLISETRTGGLFLQNIEREAGVVRATDVRSQLRVEQAFRIMGQSRFQPLSLALQRQLELSDLSAEVAALEALEPATLSTGQREALEVVAQRLLTLRPDWNRNLSRATGLEPAEFFAPSLSSGDTLGKEVLAAETGCAPVDPAFESGTLPLAASEVESLLDRWRKRFRDMNGCINGMSAMDRKAAERRWALQGFIQSQLFTIGGNLLGSKTVDWRSLPTDMLVSALWSGVNARALFSTTRVTVQWLRLEAMSQARSGLDAAIYFVNPYKDTHGKTDLEATLERERFNATYNLASPFITIGTQRLLMGLECLFPGGRTRALTSGLRFASQIGTTFVYYRLRSEALDGG